jgi:hypothetical protein
MSIETCSCHCCSNRVEELEPIYLPDVTLQAMLESIGQKVSKK